MTESQNEKAGKKGKPDENGKQTLFTGSRRAIIGGLLAAVIALFGQWLIGQVYGAYEARKFLEAMSASARYLGSSIVTASATILALMLTLISFVNQADKDFEQVFFRRIEKIGLLATIELIGGILLLLFLSVPFQESNEVPGSWFTIIYYVLIAFLAFLSGLLVAIVLMLLNAITSMIDAVRPSTHDEDDKETGEK